MKGAVGFLTEKKGQDVEVGYWVVFCSTIYGAVGCFFYNGRHGTVKALY